MARCRSCNALVVFVRMQTGALMPCDPGPDSGGNVAALKTAGRFHAGRVLTKNDPHPRSGEVQLMAHFGTCTDPDAHRKPRPKKAPAAQPETLF